MSDKGEAVEHRFGGLKWLLVVALVLVGVVGNSLVASASHFLWVPLIDAGMVNEAVELDLIFRALFLVVLGAIAFFIASTTPKGAAFLRFSQGALVEMRKVVWPSRQETNQTTLIVVAVVAVMMLILWLLDSLLGWAASKIIG